jgi:hypothetical protein
MSATIRKNDAAPDTWTTVHPLSPEDSTAITALRRMVASMKGKLEGSTARGPFNAIIERVAAPQGVTFEADTVGGISGWWARAADGKKGAAVLHLHGGWFNWGTVTPRMVSGLPEVRGFAPRLVEQTVSGVQLFQELGTIAGRLLFAFLVVRIATQKHLLRVFLVPGLIVFSGVYFFAATHSLRLLEYGIFLAGLLLNGPFSLWGNYLPRMYPTHLRGTGETFAISIGARVIGASGVLLTTQLTNLMPGGSAAARLAYSAGTLAVLAYSLSLIGSFWLREPEHAQLPD